MSASPLPCAPPPASPADAETPSLADTQPKAQREALARAVARWSIRFGSASTAELGLRAVATLAGHDAEAEALCWQLERAHVARFGRAALNAERSDDVARTSARESDRELAHYQHTWERRLARLQRAHPGRWRVPGLSDDEVRDAITLHLIELIVAPPGGEPPPGRPGKRWGLCMAQAQLAILRRTFRLGALPTDFDATPVLERAPNQEERCLELEADQRRALAGARAERQLNRPQRTWLGAMQHAAADGEFFASSDQLNLSAASRQLGKNRSSAQRAYRALQECFQRELARLE